MGKRKIKRTLAKKDNPRLKRIIELFYNAKSGFWKKIALELAKPRKRRNTINLSKIDKYAPEGAIVVVPGKVLGAGSLSKKVTVYAFDYSESAKRGISLANGKALHIEDAFNKISGKDAVIII